MSDIRENVKNILTPVVEEVAPFEELQASFDPSGLEAEIEKRLGFKPAGLSITLGGKEGNSKVMISTDNLIDKAGIMDQVMAEVAIDNFGGTVGTDEKTDEVYAWVPVHMTWKHMDGGTNGGEWFTAWYYFEKKEWKFRDVWN